MGVGVWTLVEKSDYLSLLASSTFAVSAYILILAGGLVVVTGFLGCCAVIREQRSCLSVVRLWRLESFCLVKKIKNHFDLEKHRLVTIQGLIC